MLYNVDSKAELFKKRFRPGTRIELISSTAGASLNLHQGSRGTIKNYTEEGSLNVLWDEGVEFPLIPGIDQFKQLNVDAKIQEAEAVRMAKINSKSKQKTKAHQNSLDKEL